MSMRPTVTTSRQEEIDNAAVVYGDRTKLRPGYLKYKNNCDDDVIDDKDKIVVGNTIPEVTYSFGVHMGWKGLSLEAQFQGVGEVSTYPRASRGAVQQRCPA